MQTEHRLNHGLTGMTRVQILNGPASTLEWLYNHYKTVPITLRAYDSKNSKFIETSLKSIAISGYTSRVHVLYTEMNRKIWCGPNQEFFVCTEPYPSKSGIAVPVTQLKTGDRLVHFARAWNVQRGRFQHMEKEHSVSCVNITGVQKSEPLYSLTLEEGDGFLSEGVVVQS